MTPEEWDECLTRLRAAHGVSENEVIDQARQDAIAEVFGRAISNLSEELWCAGWYDGIEFGLWEATQGLDTWHGNYYRAWQPIGNLLIELTGGWIEYAIDPVDYYRLVPMNEWLSMYEAWKSAKRPSP